MSSIWPMVPSRIFSIMAWRADEWRHIRPAPIFRFFFSAASPARRIAEIPPGSAAKALLHEHVDALLDGVLEMRGAETGVRGQQGHVAGTQAVDGVPVGVEAQRIAAPWVRRPCCRTACSMRCAKPPGDWGRDRPWRTAWWGFLSTEEGIAHRAAAAIAAADERQADGAILGGVHMRHDLAGQDRHVPSLAVSCKNFRRGVTFFAVSLMVGILVMVFGGLFGDRKHGNAELRTTVGNE